MEGGVGHQGPQNGIAEELQALVGEFHGPTLGGGRMGDGREQVLGALEGATHNLLGALELGLLFCGEAHRASEAAASPFSSAPTAAEAGAGAEATRSAMTSGTWARTVAAATAMPFFTAVSLEEPCPTMTAPLTPSSGVPP